MSINVLVFDYRDTEHDFFKSKDFENFNIKFIKESLNENSVKALSQEDRDNAMVISIFIDSEVTEEVLNRFKNLRIVATRSTGYDHINTTACLKRNISLVNVVDYGSTSVAQYTFGLIIALVRNIVISSDCMKGLYNTPDYSFVGRDLSKLTIGVVGTGAIGGAVCKLAHAFGMKILAYDVNQKIELTEKYKIEYVALEELLKRSDIVTLHAPFTGKNKNMISYNQFDLMKPSAFLINTSRGELVNLKALKDALDNKRLKGVALDVLQCETYNKKCTRFIKQGQTPPECIEAIQITDEIIHYPNVIITPHIAYETQDAINYILQCSFDGISDTVKGGTKYRVI